jgi:hypothetical protein
MPSRQVEYLRRESLKRLRAAAGDAPLAVAYDIARGKFTVHLGAELLLAARFEVAVAYIAGYVRGRAEAP